MIIPSICFLLSFSFKNIVDANIETTRLSFSIGKTTLASPRLRDAK